MPAHGSTPFLRLDNATFRLGDRLVFPNTSWIFRRGEQWGVIGPNGSGKSLLADCLRGQLPLVGGELQYHFRAPRGLGVEEAIGLMSFDERRREVHETVVQSRWNSLEEQGALVVREHLSFERVMDINPFEVRGDDRAPRAVFAARLRRAARLLELSALWNRALLSLSNGERQRVELARVLCRPLRLLILDEPFAALDRPTRDHFSRGLERLMATSLRVLLISTRPEDLPRPVTHLLYVRNCRILQAGPRGRIPPRPNLPSARSREDFSASMRFSPDIDKAPKRHPTSPRAGGATDSLRNQTHNLVQLRGVTVRYGDDIILNHLDWTIRQGESWALLGPNGSGKSTLLALIAGDHPQAYVNDVVIFGRKRGQGESIWDIKRRIGWVSPELQTYFRQEATCFEVAASGFFDSNGLFESPAPRHRRAALAWLERFGLRQFASTPLFMLSAGLQRMALMARALVKRPALLLLDEPCQGLDLAHCHLLVRMVDKLIRARATVVVYVTHREEEIPPTITRVLRLGSNT